LLSLFAESDSFWEFLANLLGISYAELENIGLSEIKEIITSLLGDEQVAAFFTSFTGAGQKVTTAE